MSRCTNGYPCGVTSSVLLVVLCHKKYTGTLICVFVFVFVFEFQHYGRSGALIITTLKTKIPVVNVFSIVLYCISRLPLP